MLPILPWSEASDACRGREIDVQFPRSTDENLTRAIGKLRVASLHDTSLPMSECPRAALPRSHCSRHEDTNAGSVVLNLHPVPAGGSNRPLLRGAIPVGESNRPLSRDPVPIGGSNRPSLRDASQLRGNARLLRRNAYPYGRTYRLLFPGRTHPRRDPTARRLMRSRVCCLLSQHRGSKAQVPAKRLDNRGLNLALPSRLSVAAASFARSCLTRAILDAYLLRPGRGSNHRSTSRARRFPL